MSKIEFLTQIIIKMKEKNYPSNFCVFVNHNAFCINCAIGRKTTCHGEESFKTTRPSCFCHYERSEVIQKQVLFAKRLLPPRHKCGSWQAYI